MGLQTWQETLINSNVDGVAVANTVTRTSLLGGVGTGASHAKLTLPANYLQVGRVLRVSAQGRISTVVTTPGTLTLDLQLGSVIVANGGALSLNIVAKTNVPWWLEWVLTCRTIGSGTIATFMHQGLFQSEAVIGSPLPTAGGNGSLLIPTGAPAVGTGFDSTALGQFDIFATWSIANAANSVQLHQYRLEALN